MTIIKVDQEKPTTRREPAAQLDGLRETVADWCAFQLRNFLGPLSLPSTLPARPDRLLVDRWITLTSHPSTCIRSFGSHETVQSLSIGYMNEMSCILWFIYETIIFYLSELIGNEQFVYREFADSLKLSTVK